MADNTILLFDKLAKTFTDKYRALLAAHDYASMQSMPPITMGGFTIRQARDDYTQAILQGGTFNIPYYITDSSGRTVRTGEGQAPFPSDIVGGTSDYDDLTDKPSINSVILSGNKTSSDLSLASATHSHTKSEITDFPSLATVATTGDYDDLSDKPSIPTKTSDLNNDSGFITGYTETDPVFTASAAHGITSSDISDWNNKSDFSGDYDDLTNKPTIPTKTSDLNNDSGFITSETDPVFTASDAYGISSSDITAWNGKSTVSINRKTSSGTNIADITIDGTTTQLYAPSGGGGTSDYDSLSNRPQINSTTLTGNKSSSDLGLADASHSHTTSDITDFPSLATVATTGDYDDLIDKPSDYTYATDSANGIHGFVPAPLKPSNPNHMLQVLTAKYGWQSVSLDATIGGGGPNAGKVLVNLHMRDNGSSTDSIYKYAILPNATTTSSGTMSAADKTKLDGAIDTAGTGLSKSSTTLNHSNSITAQTTQAVYPIKIDAQGHISEYGSAVTIPTVNNATLTIQKNSTNVATFTANASSNVTANISVPTTASDVGALPITGGTITGSLTINNHSSAIGTVKQSYASAKSVASGTNTNLTSISLEAGTWVVTGGVRFPNNATGYRKMNIGTSSASSWADVQLPALSGASTQLAYTVIVSPTSTTTYYLNCYHNAGKSLSLVAGGSENGINFLRAVRIA